MFVQILSPNRKVTLGYDEPGIFRLRKVGVNSKLLSWDLESSNLDPVGEKFFLDDNYVVI